MRCWKSAYKSWSVCHEKVNSIVTKARGLRQEPGLRNDINPSCSSFSSDATLFEAGVGGFFGQLLSLVDVSSASISTVERRALNLLHRLSSLGEWSGTSPIP